MPERHLKIGAIVKTKFVPPYATLQIERTVKYPAPPKVGYKSAAGHTEYKDAPPDSPEWQEYSERMAELTAKVDALKSDFTYDYGVEAWSWDEGKTWQTDPPDSWQFPEKLRQYGIMPSANKRVDYIRLQLLILNEDVGRVLSDTVGLTEPITNQEVDAALGLFPGDDPGRNTA